MLKEPLHINRGFTLIEVVVSASLLILFIALFVGAMLYGEESQQTSGMRMRAGLIAEEGLEAARNMRDQQFSNLIDGTYGVTRSSDAWVFSGSSGTQDIFTRSVAVFAIDPVTKHVTSTVTWPQSAGRTGTVSVVTYLTNTQLLSRQANNLVVNVSSADVAGAGNRELRNITLQNVGTTPITISTVAISWTNALRRIQEVNIDGTIVWSRTGPGTPTGVQPSGTTLNMQDITIAAGETVPINRILFDGNIGANTFTITFTVSDGSTKTATTLQIL